MVGIDLFFKSAAAGMKIAQLWVENMFKMVEFFAGFSCQQTTFAKKEASVSEKRPDTSQNHKPMPAKEPEPDSDKTASVSPVKPEPASVVESPKISESATPRKTSSVSPKESLSKDKKSSNATEEVRKFIARQKQGTSIDHIVKATGFTKKKVQDILYKLKRRGVLKSEKGIYTQV